MRDFVSFMRGRCELSDLQRAPGSGRHQASALILALADQQSTFPMFTPGPLKKKQRLRKGTRRISMCPGSRPQSGPCTNEKDDPIKHLLDPSLGSLLPSRLPAGRLPAPYENNLFIEQFANVPGNIGDWRQSKCSSHTRRIRGG